MRTNNHINRRGNGLVVVVSVVATILAILGAAVSYTGHVSRLSQRTRRTALAVEIADGHLEYLFTNWRNIYRTAALSYNSGGNNYALLPTNYFYTSMYSPTPAPSAIPYMTPAATPPIIPLPAKSNFPTEANYTVTQYRIQAVDPMIQLDPRAGSTFENALQESSFGSCSDTVLNCVNAGNLIPLPPAAAPPAGYGPNTWQYSFYYLAAADVTVPAIGANNGGTVKAKVRRVFEKRFDNPWTYAMFYSDDLEFQPSSSFTINGPIQANKGLYIGTTNFTATSQVGYAADYVNGNSPNDTTTHSGAGTPNFPAGAPPSQTPVYLPFGWNLDLSGANGNNNDSYHEIIERPVSGTDALANVRYYDQAGYRIVINADTTVTVQRVDSSGSVTTLSGSGYNTWVGNNGLGSSTTILQQNQPLYDAREGGAVKVTNVDVSKIVSNFG